MIYVYVCMYVIQYAKKCVKCHLEANLALNGCFSRVKVRRWL